MNIKKYFYTLTALVGISSLFATVPALAAETTTNGTGNLGNHSGRVASVRPVVFGTVTAISGNTITVSAKQGFGTSATAKTMTVDATNAKITKNNVTITVSDIAVGDTLIVQGIVNGTNVTATIIHDGVTQHSNNKTTTPKPPIINGNGEPVVAGTVSAISGNTITITNKSNVTYTIDASSAKITEGQNTITISNVSVGDMIIVQGAVNGNSVTASSVIDEHIKTTGTGKHKGLLGSVESFFSHLFGF